MSLQKLSKERYEMIMKTHGDTYDTVKNNTGINSYTYIKLNKSIPEDKLNKISQYLEVNPNYLIMKSNVTEVPRVLKINANESEIMPVDGYYDSSVININILRDLVLKHGWSYKMLNEFIGESGYSFYNIVKTTPVKKIPYSNMQNICYYLKADINYIAGRSSKITFGMVPSSQVTLDKQKLTVDSAVIRRLSADAIKKVSEEIGLPTTLISEMKLKKIKVTETVAAYLLASINRNYDSKIKSVVEENADLSHVKVPNTFMKTTDKMMNKGGFKHMKSTEKTNVTTETEEALNQDQVQKYISVNDLMNFINKNSSTPVKKKQDKFDKLADEIRALSADNQKMIMNVVKSMMKNMQ